MSARILAFQCLGGAVWNIAMFSCVGGYLPVPDGGGVKFYTFLVRLADIGGSMSELIESKKGYG